MLAKWLKKWHKQYAQLIANIQKLMAVVTLAEQAERARWQRVATIVEGIDHSKEACVTCRLELPGNQQEAVRLVLISPTQGRHKYGNRNQP